MLTSKSNTCPICKYESLIEKEAVPYPSLKRSDNSLKRIIFCSKCGLGVGDPHPSELVLEKMYNESGYWGNVKPVVSVRKQPMMYNLAQARWSLIESNLLKRKNLVILDIGAGFGYLGLSALQSTNISLKQYVAVETDKRLNKALEKAWLKWNGDSKLTTCSTLNQVQGNCDVVAFSHILEHVNKPLEIIEEAKHILSDDGILFIDVPNSDYQFKSDVFPHLLFFSIKNIRLLLEKAEMQIVHLNSWGTSKEISPLNFNAPRKVHLMCGFLNRFQGLLPVNLVLRFYSELFGVNSQCSNGIWIRAIAQKT